MNWDTNDSDDIPVWVGYNFPDNKALSFTHPHAFSTGALELDKQPENPSTENGMLTYSMDCSVHVQISSLYCSFTIFYSFLGQLLSYLLKKAHVYLCKVGQTLLCALQCATSTSVNIL